MTSTTSTILSATLACVALAPGVLPAQSPFAAPVRIQAGDEPLGQKRLFPSPVWHDMNGDGRLDLVIGDLPGALTVALRKPSDGAEYDADKPLQAADGKPIKFHNW